MNKKPYTQNDMDSIAEMDQDQIWDIYKERGITSTFRTGEGFKVWVTENGVDRLATEEETQLHERSVYLYHLEEASVGPL